MMTRPALSRVSAALGTLALGAALGLVPASPAHGADAGSGITIDHVEVSDDGTVSVLVGVEAGAATPDLSSIHVSLDGQDVEAVGQTVEEGQLTRTTVLALDASHSMKGPGIAQAKAAATAFLDAAPADVRIGLLTFSRGVQNVTAPTTDRASLAAAINDIALTRGTRIYDAVVKAVSLSGTEGARNVLLLTDGKDEGGGATLQTALATAKGKGVAVDVVALDQAPADRALLAQISSASGGEVVEASSPASLARVFEAEAAALAHQVLVTFPEPVHAPAGTTLDVSLAVGGTTYDDSAFLSLGHVRDNGPTAVDPGKPLVGSTALLVGGGVLALGLTMLLALLLMGQHGPTRTQKRLSEYFGETTRSSSSAAGLRESAVNFAGTVVKGDFETRLAQKLAGAGIALTASEWVLMHAGIAIVSGFVGFVLGGPVAMVVLLLVGALLPAGVLKLKHSRRMSAFGAQLPETLTLIAGSLSAGMSMPQAVDTVVREGHEPMASELRRALVEQRLGIPIEDALDGVADRMCSEDFAWVVMAIRIQHDVGGNLSEVLGTVADTLREREYLKRQVRTLSAEGRLSAWILGALPVVMFLYMLMANREFIRPLYTQALGWAMLGAATLLLAMGSWFMAKLAKVEV